jgi:hypothetical protein
MQGIISLDTMKKAKPAKSGPPKVEPWKDKPLTVEYETKAKNLLRGELRRRGITTAQLVEKLAAIGIQETERNLNNKISRGGFTAAFLLQCLAAIGSDTLHL